MKNEQGIIIVYTAALIGILLVFSLHYDPKRRFFVWTRRVFWRCSALMLIGALGGIGLNAFTGAAAALLGLPGYAALAVISRMR